TAGPSRWADSRRSYHLQQVRANLIKAAAEPAHDRDWRPYILAFNNQPENLRHLLTFAAWLEGGSGMTVLTQIIEGHGVKARALRETAQKELQQVIIKDKFKAFPLAVTSEDMETGIHHLTQIVGIGPLKTNTMLVNWKGKRSPGGQGFQEIIFGRNLREAFRQGCHSLILATEETKWPQITSADKPRIDIWWQNDATGRLMLLLAYLITRHADWSEGHIRVLAADEALPGTPDEDGQMLSDLLATFRIEGEPLILPSSELEELKRATADATLLFLPFRFRDNLIALEWEGPTEDILQQLPTTVMANAARDVDLEAEPEEGRAAELAEIRDTLVELQGRLEKARQEAARAAEALDRSQTRLSAMLEADTGHIDLQAKKSLEREVETAAFQAEKNRRRALKLEAKLELGQKEAQEQGVLLADDAEPSESEAE
ncbi:MAG: hypothetical protein PVG19_10315, partial [Desulfobacterales bacterium]